MYGIVYVVTNLLDDMQYVGQTIKSLKERWLDHGLPSNKRNLYFGNAIRRYGRGVFAVECVHECQSKEEMDFVETFYISLLNTVRPNGYNLTTGGEGTPGHSVSKEGILKMRLSHLGKKQSEETKKKRSEALRAAHQAKQWGFPKGKTLSSAYPKGYVPWNKGLTGTLKHTEEAKLRIGLHTKMNPRVPKGTPWSPARRAAQELRKVKDS